MSRLDLLPHDVMQKINEFAYLSDEREVLFIYEKFSGRTRYDILKFLYGYDYPAMVTSFDRPDLLTDKIMKSYFYYLDYDHVSFEKYEDQNDWEEKMMAPIIMCARRADILQHCCRQGLKNNIRYLITTNRWTKKYIENTFTYWLGQFHPKTYLELSQEFPCESYICSFRNYTKQQIIDYFNAGNTIMIYERNCSYIKCKDGVLPCQIEKCKVIKLVPI